MDDRTLEDLARQAGEALAARGWMLATAESCTGGWLAQAVTGIAGSSAWFERGFVTYTDASKRELLGVGGGTLGQHGAVSAAVAREMAEGALARSHAQVAVAVTGIAGPGGGTSAKPVGTVCFAWVAQDGSVSRDTRLFAGGREAVRRQSVAWALQGILALLRNCPPGTA
ncbi:CinA family protein [Nitrosovibrio sp. Nv17]|uniref:CinA family protein n=1 Tax=Nitrosovibrio sp. Nv17 TaxID=1855339 RepID=UPI0009086AD8|nr:nicotinamide-nucleotide amidohydrolase family protein [Nitrosovibrio sp. Nv17]SFW22934.1 nicotinamide-nucleotide amidase [Nitrosovibrio sp. Nv17]